MRRTGPLLAALLGAALLVIGAYDPSRWSWMVTGSLVLGGAVVWCWHALRPSWYLVLGGALAARLLLFPLEPGLSDDTYRYLWDGLVQLRGLNPFLYLPTDPALAGLRDGALFPLLNSAERYTVYPPVSQGVFALSALFHQPGTLTAYYAMKGAMVLFDAGTVALLARMCSPRAVLLYAWNPLILIELTGQAHEEAIMVFFLVGTVWLLRRERERGAVVALTLAGWVKLYPFFLMPFLLRRVGWRRVWTCLLVSVLVWLPYASIDVVDHVLESLRLYVQLFEFNAGPYYLVKEIFRLLTGADWSKDLGPAFGAVFLAGLPVAYWWDRRSDWSWTSVAVGVVGAYFALATTVHPWYLAGIIALVPLLSTVAWHWIWLGVWSMGTYLFYVDGPYWPFVIVGWLGWGCLLAYRHAPVWLRPLMRRRARGKWALLEEWIPVDARHVLDVGSAEGYLGELLDARGYEVELVDVLPIDRSDLPFRVFDGRTLPYEVDEFDCALLVYVLHHAENPRELLREALRVSPRVLVLESTYEHPWERRVLRVADHVANRLRSGGRMAGQEIRLRRDEEWRSILRAEGRLSAARVEERGPHRRALYVLERSPSPT